MQLLHKMFYNCNRTTCANSSHHQGRDYNVIKRHDNLRRDSESDSYMIIIDISLDRYVSEEVIPYVEVVHIPW
jgi:hypothetical protein